MQVRTLVSLLALFAFLAGPSARAAEPAAKEPADLIQDQPGIVQTGFQTAVAVAGWTWDAVKSGLAVIAPPMPTSLTRSVSEEDKAELFKLLNIAGYKLKEIDTQVGIIPTVAFKFAMIRELSAADVDFLDAALEKSKVRNPGLYTELQRTIVGTVMTINSGDDYLVSELKVGILPLPKVAFSVSPKVTALSEEGSALMRAIQKVDRKVMGVGRKVGSAPTAAGAAAMAMAPADMTDAAYYGIKLSDWMLGGALALLALGLLNELRRQLSRAAGRPTAALTYLMFMLSAGIWSAYAYLTGSMPGLVGGGLAAALSLALAAQRLRDRQPPVAGASDAEAVTVSESAPASAPQAG